MAKTGGGGAKPAAKKTKKAMPPTANKGGAVRGQQRAAQAQTFSLPSLPANFPNVTGVPQIDLFHSMGRRFAQVTGQSAPRGRGRGRRK